MKDKALLLITICMSLIVFGAYSQNVANNEFISLSSQSSVSLAESSENLSNGTVNVSLPIYKLTLDNGVNLPITLNYSGGNGIKVNQYHSWVGMGWNISATMNISRQIRGATDFDSGASGGPGVYERGYLSTHCGSTATGGTDAEPDIYTVQLLGQTIRFFYDVVHSTNGEWRTIPYNPDISIQEDVTISRENLGPDFGYDRHYRNQKEISFIINDQYGFEYHFGGFEYTEFSNTYNLMHSASIYMESYPVKWHISKIVCPFSKREVLFTYADERYSYYSGISTQSKSLETEKSMPSDNLYPDYPSGSEFSRTMVNGKRLRDITFGDTKIDFVATSENTAYVNDNSTYLESKMLNYIDIYSNDQKILRHHLRYDFQTLGVGTYPTNYTRDKNINWLATFKQIPVTSNSNSYNGPFKELVHNFEYYNIDQVPRRLSLAQDYWGYYNGADNTSLIPSLHDFGGNKRFAPYADRRANGSVSYNGLLKSIEYPAGGKTIYEYESNIGRVTENIYNGQVSSEITQCLNCTTEEIWCILDSETPTTYEQSTYSFTIDDRLRESIDVSDLLLDHDILECSLASFYFDNWILYKEQSGGAYVEIDAGYNDHLSLSFNHSYGTGNFKLEIAYKPSTTFKHWTYDYSSSLEGAGARVSKKLETDDNHSEIDETLIDADDKLTTYTYPLGKWGYDFLPSIEAELTYSAVLNKYYLYNQPLIPALTDGPLNFSAKAAVISSLRRSPLQEFMSPIYYEFVTVEQKDIPGHILYQYTTPSHTISGGTCKYFNRSNGSTSPVEPIKLNNKMRFIEGGMEAYWINGDYYSDQMCQDYLSSVLRNGLETNKEVFDVNGNTVEKTTTVYERTGINFPLGGIIGKKYVEDRRFDFFWHMTSEETKSICQPYNINLENYRIKERKHKIDGTETILEYTYDNTNRLKLLETKLYNTYDPSHFKREKFTYVDGLPASNVKNALITNNLLGTPFIKEVFWNQTLVDGYKSDYKISNDGLIVKENLYRVEGGQFVLSAKVTNWDSWGRELTVYRSKKDAVAADPVTDASKFIQLPTNNIYNPNDLDELSSITVGNRTTSFSYHSNGNLSGIVDFNNVNTSYTYDELNRILYYLTDNGHKKTKFRYKYDQHNRTVTNTQEVSFPMDQNLSVQKKVSIMDGLERKTIEKLENFDGLGGELIKEENFYTDAGYLSRTNIPGAGSSSPTYDESPIRRVSTMVRSGGANDLQTSYSFSSNPTKIDITDHSGNVISYPPNTLKTTLVTDPNGNHVLEYSNYLDILIRTTKFDGTTEVNLDNIYNNKGQILSQRKPDGTYDIYSYDSSTDLMTSLKTPSQDIPIEYVYDNQYRKVLTKDANGDQVTFVYDDYDRVIIVGNYTENFPGTSHIFTAPIPSSDYNLLTELTFDGANFEKVYLKTITESIINSDGTFSNDRITKDFSNDDRGRPTNSIMTSHLGTTETMTKTFNDADQVISTSQTHLGLDGMTTTFDWVYHFDVGERAVGYSLNNERVSTLEYNDTNRLFKRKLHQTQNSGNNYLQEMTYTYDGFGRLKYINDINQQTGISCDDYSSGFCEITIPLNVVGPSGQTTISIDQIIIINNEGLEENVLSQPYTLDVSDQSSIDQFKSILSIDLQDYIFDEIIIDQTDLKITQTNITVQNITSGNLTIEAITSNCCNQLAEVSLFAQKLVYDGSLVKENHWSNVCNKINIYQYGYDDLGRLMAADYSYKDISYGAPIGDINTYDNGTYDHATYKTNQTGNYSTSYDYDVMGNMLNNYRRGYIAQNQSYNAIDDLVYNYDNQTKRLNSVSDQLSQRPEGYSNPGINTIYSYDAAGNVSFDPGKNLIISYNVLHKAQRMNQAGKQLEIIYSGSADRLQKKFTNNAGEVQYTFDYIGNVEYRNNKLFAISYPDGRALINPSDQSLDYEYVIKDYKNQPRVTFKDKDGDGFISVNDILEKKDYYPYGMVWDDPVPIKGNRNDDVYQNMDWVREFDIYFATHRILDPVTARWLQPDPKSPDLGFISSYSSMASNPVMFDDSHGDSPLFIAFITISTINTLFRIGKIIHNHRRFNNIARQNKGQTIPGLQAVGLIGFELFNFALNFYLPGPIKVFTSAKVGAHMANTFLTSFAKSFLISAANDVVDGNRLDLDDKNGKGEHLINALIDATIDATISGISRGMSLKKGAKKAGLTIKDYVSKIDAAPKVDYCWNPKYKVSEFNYNFSKQGTLSQLWSVTNTTWNTIGTAGQGWYFGHYEVIDDGGVPVPVWGGLFGKTVSHPKYEFEFPAEYWHVEHRGSLPQFIFSHIFSKKDN